MLKINEKNKYGWSIRIVGLGGTGGYVFYFLARLLYSLKNDVRTDLVLVDGDIVTENNLLRQNFIPKDVNRYKVEVDSERYGGVYGLQIGTVTEYLEDLDGLLEILKVDSDWIPVLVGCVDNNKSRQLFHEAFKKLPNLVYIDSGNGFVTEDPEDADRWTGQVVVGVKQKGKVLLPPVGIVFPDILTDTETWFPSQQSCGEAVVSNPQIMATNIKAAQIVFAQLNNLLTEGCIETHYTTFNTKRTLEKPYYINKGA